MKVRLLAKITSITIKKGGIGEGRLCYFSKAACGILVLYNHNKSLDILPLSLKFFYIYKKLERKKKKGRRAEPPKQN